MLFLYLLRWTGKDRAILKGVGFGLIAYIIFYGLLMAVDSKSTSNPG